MKCVASASYLSIDSSRSSGSEVRVQGPRRRLGFESGERDAIYRTKFGHVLRKGRAQELLPICRVQRSSNGVL